MLHAYHRVLKVVFALSFGSGEGEGGPFALFLLIFPRRSSQEDADDDRELTKFDSKDVALLENSHHHSASWLAKARWPLLIWVSSEGTCCACEMYSESPVATIITDAFRHIVYHGRWHPDTRGVCHFKRRWSSSSSSSRRGECSPYLHRFPACAFSGSEVRNAEAVFPLCAL